MALDRPTSRRAFLRAATTGLLMIPIARLGRVLARRRPRRLTRADLAPVPWIGHC